MATAALNTNVVRLPTAASRKVKNPIGLGLIAAAEGLPKHPATWEDHGGNKAWQDARFDRSPEMLIITAIFKLLPDAAKEEIRKKVGTLADLNFSPHAPTALHILECAK
ncbi:hypothetical protein [Sphingomonas fennica]|uniref:Uncharacterized protein n=1 Tax=Edaphosphingomonas fennica TaxID=114404 RepID=A0A2T4HVQ3_9SPHN|nr:hypothetical protein [Sphingomonas fennica]PTD19898.1 hypothetical protein CV103_11965 [Sphingomonas fennica]